MPITTNQDIMFVRDLITNDPYIKSLGFTPINITGVKNSNFEIKTDNMEINIYNVDGKGTDSDIVISMIYQIDIMVPKDKYNIANEAKDQIIALLQHYCEKSGFRYKLVHPGLILTVPPSYYGIGFRFSFYETIFNKIKKVKESEEKIYG